VGVDGGQVDGNVRVLDRAGIEERRHEIDEVVRALEVEGFVVLPAVPNRPHSSNVLPHPRTQAIP
jgi:hypothetical protein